MSEERLPPHDLAAEEAVLGSLLMDSEAVYTVAPLLQPEDFYRQKHRWVYEACLALHDRNEVVNQVTVAHELVQEGRLEPIGGHAFLAQLVATVPTPLHVAHYSHIVQRDSLRRRLIGASGQIAVLAYQAGSDAEGALAKAEELLFGLSQGRVTRDFVHVRQVLEGYLEESGFEPREPHEELGYVSTGFADIDALLGGLQRSDLIIVAARPSLGKTSLALNIAYNAARRQGARVGIFSLEMSKEQLVQRLLCSQAGVDSHKLRTHSLSDAEHRRIMEATGILSELPIYIDDTPLLRVAEMRSKARRLAAERGVDLLVLDYLQLVHGSGRSDNRVQEVSDISRSLKALARELSIPVLALSQLSRAVEARTPHRPQLSDLRESGSIEQDADVVMFIYRDEVYFSERDWERQFPNKSYPKGIAEIILAKHRNGPTGQVSLFFFEKTTHFADLEVKRAQVP